MIPLRDPSHQERRNLDGKLVLLVLGIIGLIVGAVVAVNRWQNTKNTAPAVVVADAVPSASVSTSVPVLPDANIATPSTPVAASPVKAPVKEPVVKAPAKKPTQEPAKPKPDPVKPTVPETVTPAPAAPAGPRGMPAGLRGVVAADEWGAVRRALNTAFAQGEDATPVPWQSRATGQSGSVVQSGTGVDPDGCRQFRVVNDADPGNRGYADVCAGTRIR